MPTVIVVAPMACGKTRNADAIARRFGCHSVVDDWSKRDMLLPGALHLTNEMPSVVPNGVQVVQFDTLALSAAAGAGTRDIQRIRPREIKRLRLRELRRTG